MEFLKQDEIKIGTKFMSSGKHKKVCEVVDILKTYNVKNELVKTSYIERHEFLGQTIKSEVVAVTIQKNHIQ